jgi:transposase InsO family protein
MYDTKSYDTLHALQGAHVKLEASLSRPNAFSDGNAADAITPKSKIRGGYRGRGTFRGGRSGRSNGRRGQEVVCYTCGCTGHPARLCPDRKDPSGMRREGIQPPDKHGSVANHATSCGISGLVKLLHFSTMPCAPQDCPELAPEAQAAEVNEELLYDSGCNMHLTSRFDLLHDFMPVPMGWPQSVAWGKEQASDPVHGVGTLVLKVGNRLIRVEDVSLVKSARCTLLCSKLLHRQTGTHPCIDEHGVQDGLYDEKDKLVISLDTSRDLQFLRACPVPALGQAAHASGVLWHERLAHPGIKKVRALQQKGLVPTLQGGPTQKDECVGCAPGKATSTPREHAPDKRGPLAGERLHADIAFPAVKGIGGESCVLTTIDEGSRYVRVFPLATKGQAADVIGQLVNDNDRVKKQRVHWDRGGEFTGHKLMQELRAKGIQIESSPAGQPECNAMMERLHGTLMPHLRAVMLHRAIPLALWPMMIKGVVYIHNRLPCDALNGQIPYEVWTGRPLESLRHLRVLGCRCYYREPHPDAKRAARAHQGILVDFVSDGRGRTAVYRVCDLAQKRIIESADVDFDERPPSTALEPPLESTGRAVFPFVLAMAPEAEG